MLNFVNSLETIASLRALVDITVIKRKFRISFFILAGLDTGCLVELELNDVGYQISEI